MPLQEELDVLERPQPRIIPQGFPLTASFQGKLQDRAESPAFLLSSRDAADGTVSQVLPDAVEPLVSRRCSCVPRVTILSGC